MALALAAVFVVWVAAIVARQRSVGDDIEVIRGGDSPASYRIDLNRAPVQELTLLPGIGRVRGDRIVKWREEHGRFESLDQVRKAAGLSAKGAERLRPLVTLGGPSPKDGP